jgi:hypothetical protein
MENNLTIQGHQGEITNIINNSNNMHLAVLSSLGLPIDNVLSSLDERKVAIANLPFILDKLLPNQISDAYYLSKFFVAVATGLFDAALNYLWDETIKQLRIRIINGDIKYFFDVVISDDKRKNFSSPEDLLKLDDYDLIKGALQIDLISQLGYKHLDYIRYMRNWASAAHPNQAELTGLNLVSWLEICIKEVISTPPSSILIQINRLLFNVKNTIVDVSQAETISGFFTELNNDKADALAKGLFGIYIDSKTSQQARANINLLAPDLWIIISDEVKYEFGLRYATFIANGDNQSANNAKQFLELVDGLSYLPDSVKTPQIRSAIENLVVAHNNINNFYNEPPFARQLLNIIGKHGSIPNQLIYQYTKSIVTVFMTNGNGVCWSAEPLYIELIKNFNAKQAFIALTSFTDEKIKSKLQFPLCMEKFIEMMNYLQPNITSAGVLELMENIKKRKNDLFRLSQTDKLIEKISYYSRNILR